MGELYLETKPNSKDIDPKIHDKLHEIYDQGLCNIFLIYSQLFDSFKKRSSKINLELEKKTELNTK